MSSDSSFSNPADAVLALTRPMGSTGRSNAHRADEDDTGRELSGGNEPGRADEPGEAKEPGGTPSGPGGRLLSAVSTLIALTPRGRQDELTRLSALAHGMIGIASEEEIVALAKAVASRDDLELSLADRLAQASPRAAQTLIRANRLSDECIAAFLEEGDEPVRTLIARHHTLDGKHIMMLVADGNGSVLQALLENRQTDFSGDTQRLVEAQVAHAAQAHDPTSDHGHHAQSVLVQPGAAARPSGADPRRSAQDFLSLDAAGRRAVMHRLRDDVGNVSSFTQAARKLDPTRNEADLAFLSVIEQRDPAKLCDAFVDALSLDRPIVEKLLDEADGDALIVLAKAAGLSSTAFARMLILGRIGLTGTPRDTFDLVDRFNALPDGTAALIVAAMRGEDVTRPALDQKAHRPRMVAAPETRSILSLSDERADRNTG